MTTDVNSLRVAMLWSVLAGGAIVMLLLAVSSVTLAYSSFGPVFLSIGLLAVAGVVCQRRSMATSALIMEVLAGGLALSVLALISTYLAISLGYPLADDSLVAMDRWLGFDGAAFIRLVDAQPGLSRALMLAYQSFALQLMLLPILLILLGQAARGFALVIAYGLVCAVASIVSIWYPALGSHVVYGIDPGSLSSINPHFGHAFLEQFLAAREQAEFVLSLDQAEGILTFPSVHAAVAFLCAAVAFGVPILRYPFMLLNIGMATATVTHSNHYLVDVLAGFAVAAMSLALVALLSRRRQVPDLGRPHLGETSVRS